MRFKKMAIEKTFKVYSFDELSEETQKDLISEYIRVKENDSDLLNDFHNQFLSEYLREDLRTLLKENFIEILDESEFNIYYSLSNCQGDGVCFQGIFKNNNNNTSYKINHNGRYYHYNSKEIELYNLSEGLDLSYQEEKYLIDSFNSVYIDICKELTKNGYKYIDEEIKILTSEEYAREQLSEDTYLLNGTKFNY
jgi:hypothetical protein